MYDLTNVSLGAWCDLPKNMVLTPEFFAWYANELRFDLLPIMIDDADPVVEFSWTEKDVEKALKLADPYAIEIGLTTWPYPVPELLAQMEAKMDALLGVGPVAEWETDQEFNFQDDDVKGYPNLIVASDALVKIKVRLCQKHGCRNVVTTFTYHVENSARSLTIPRADRAAIQAYATDEREGKRVTWNHRLGPGNMQRLTLDRTMKIPGVQSGDVELCVGHAAWNQEGFTEKRKVVTDKGTVDRWVSVPEKAMRVSFEASLPYHPVAHNWWSLKYIYPKSRRFNIYSEAFLKTLRADA